MFLTRFSANGGHSKFKILNRLCAAQKVLEPDELKFILSTKHKPNLVMNMISTVIRAGKLTNQEIFNMDSNLTLFSDTTGGSERIFKTPIPLSWTSESLLSSPHTP